MNDSLAALRFTCIVLILAVHGYVRNVQYTELMQKLAEIEQKMVVKP